MDTIRPEKVEQFCESIRKNQEPYGAVVEGAALIVMAYLADDVEFPEQAMYRTKGLGLSGFQEGCVASLVYEMSPRGEEFRRWWNLKNQIQDKGEKANESGGVLNPALLNIGH